MFLFALFVGGLLVKPPHAAARPCRRLIAIDVDTTVDATAIGKDRLLQQRSFGGPVYPAPLRNQRIDGAVRATFVLDTLGRVQRGTVEILEESDRAFGQSVCTFLRDAAFEPVLLRGRRATVRIVGQQFLFRTGAR